MPIFARFLTFYSEQYDESYVFKICVSLHLLECKIGRLVGDNMVFFNAKMGIEIAEKERLTKRKARELSASVAKKARISHFNRM